MKARNSDTDIGHMIYEARIEKGYTLEEVGKLLGVTKTTISKYELGIIQSFTAKRVNSLCTFLEITPNQLFGWDENKPREEKTVIERNQRVLNNTPKFLVYKNDEWAMFSKKHSASTLSGYLYVAQIGEFVKIGKSIFPYGRIASLKVTFENYGNSKVGLCAISEEHKNYTENEKLLHKYFAKERIPKSELFKVDFDKALREIQNGWTGITIS